MIKSNKIESQERNTQENHKKKNLKEDRNRGKMETKMGQVKTNMKMI